MIFISTITSTKQVVSTTTLPITITSTSFREIVFGENHCFFIGKWCVQDDYESQIEIDNVKDSYICQKKCQDHYKSITYDLRKEKTYFDPRSQYEIIRNHSTASNLGCQYFAWDSILYRCILFQECELIEFSYFVAGPRECPIE